MAASLLYGRSGFEYDTEKLVVEAGNSIYAIRNQISPRAVRHLWHGLCNYINVCIRSRKVRLVVGAWSVHWA
jgi:hypothetical protein